MMPWWNIQKINVPMKLTECMTKENVIALKHSTLLEREPLEQATEAGELMAYRHDGLWHCMDTKREGW